MKVHGIELKVQIHKDHPLVTKLTNVPNALTPILSVKPAENQVLILPNDLPIQMKFYDTAGNEWPASVEIQVHRIEPNKISRKVYASTLYQYWALTALSDQGDPRRQELLSLHFTEPLEAVAIPPGYELQILVKAPTQIDWTNAKTQIFFGLGERIRHTAV